MNLKIAVLFALLAVVFPVSAQYGLKGGFKEVDVADPMIQELHEFTINQLPQSSSGDRKSALTLLSAKTQVVSGRKTVLTYSTLDNTKCSVTIWEQPWRQFREIKSSTCGHSVPDSPKKVGTKKRDYRKTDNVMNTFNAFVSKYNKNYQDKQEYKKRYNIFKANLKKIKMMQDNEQGTASYGINEFADLSQKEFKSRLGLKKPEHVPVLPQAEIPNIQLPVEYDWRNYNAVTPVKNQGACGSCWAFSVTGNIEGQWAIRNGQLLSLSEQEIVDCDTTDSGCNGGYMYDAYEAIVNIGGLETESDYPYEAEDEKCHLDQSEIQVRIQGGVNITSDEDEMAKWLVQNGPISVALNANVMQFYMGGVSHPYKFLCNPEQLDHGVLIVGYGVHTSTVLKRTLPYWLVKNSWGTGWGEQGYYRLYRGDGSCGINRMASSAVV